MKLRSFALCQSTRFGQHTVAEVLAPNAKTAAKLFQDFYCGHGFPQTTKGKVGWPGEKGKRIGIEIGSIGLLLIETGRPDLTKLKPRVVTPIGSVTPQRQQHGIVLSPKKLQPHRRK